MTSEIEETFPIHLGQEIEQTVKTGRIEITVIEIMIARQVKRIPEKGIFLLIILLNTK